MRAYGRSMVVAGLVFAACGDNSLDFDSTNDAVDAGARVDASEGLRVVDANQGDTDGDDIPDDEDQCPDAAEDFDEFQDDDGCPDSEAEEYPQDSFVVADCLFIRTSPEVSPDNHIACRIPGSTYCNVDSYLCPLTAMRVTKVGPPVTTGDGCKQWFPVHFADYVDENQYACGDFLEP